MPQQKSRNVFEKFIERDYVAQSLRLARTLFLKYGHRVERIDREGLGVFRDSGLAFCSAPRMLPGGRFVGPYRIFKGILRAMAEDRSWKVQKCLWRRLDERVGVVKGLKFRRAPGEGKFVVSGKNTLGYRVKARFTVACGTSQRGIAFYRVFVTHVYVGGVLLKRGANGA